MGVTPQYFHTIRTSCAILPTIHTTKFSTCTLAYSHPLKECMSTHQQGTQHCSFNSLPHARQPYVPCMFSSNKSSQHNWHSNMPYRLSTARALHSFCIQDRPYLPCRVSSNPQHDFSMHINLACTTLPCSTTHPTAFHNPPMHTNNKHKV